MLCKWRLANCISFCRPAHCCGFFCITTTWKSTWLSSSRSVSTSDMFHRVTLVIAPGVMQCRILMFSFWDGRYNKHGLLDTTETWKFFYRTVNFKCICSGSGLACKNPAPVNLFAGQTSIFFIRKFYFRRIGSRYLFVSKISWAIEPA